MGLVQREVEKAGIPTVGISIVREYTEKVRPPRSVYLRWPFGHPLGEPFNAAQQLTVLKMTLSALCSIRTPGMIVDLPLRWKREDYTRYGDLKVLCDAEEAAAESLLMSGIEKP
ncbi:MAG: hypothetical protein PVJ36_03320 [Nitrospirota bacterium]